MCFDRAFFKLAYANIFFLKKQSKSEKNSTTQIFFSNEGISLVEATLSKSIILRCKQSYAKHTYETNRVTERTCKQSKVAQVNERTRDNWIFPTILGCCHNSLLHIGAPKSQDLVNLRSTSEYLFTTLAWWISIPCTLSVPK